MKRIMIIGGGGAGKSTFSRKLHELTGLELIHLDQQYWSANWVEMPKLKWKKKVKEMAAKDRWIMDGNYGGTMDIRLARADTIIFMDYPTWVLLWRITKRLLQYYGKSRPDSAEACKERFNYEFYKYVATYRKKKRPALLEKLEKLDQSKRLIVIRNDKERAGFLKKLKQEFNATENFKKG